MRTAKVLGILAVGCCGLAAVGLVAAFLAMRSCVGEPTSVTVTAQAPLNVAQGSRFEIIAAVKNSSSKDRTLFDIDIADEYLRGIAIERSDPPYATTEHIPIDNTISHHFGLSIPAGGTIEVRFTAYAAHTGDFAGDIDFCIDRETSCSSYRVRTIVGQQSNG